MMTNPRFPVDFLAPGQSPAPADMTITASELLQELESGPYFGDTHEDRLQRLERMVCYLILHGHTTEA